MSFELSNQFQKNRRVFAVSVYAIDTSYGLPD
jgi:hypothetical protein